MTPRKSHRASFLSAIKIIGGLLLLLFLSNSAFAQNTKGDKPQGNQRQVRGTNAKSVKRKEKPKTKDIAGRRLRTTDRSAASRANSSFRQPSPYSGRRKTERAASPRGKTFSNSPRENRARGWSGDISGHKIRTVKPSKSGVARNNVYPQYGPYVNNPSKKPRKPGNRKTIGRTANGNPVINRSPQQKQRAWKGNLQGGPVGSPSATGSVRNVYSQKNQYSRYAGKSQKRKSKTYSNAGIAGRNLQLNSEPGPGGRKFSIFPRSISGLFMKNGKRNPYWGKYSKGERSFNGDISGGPLRMRNFRSMPAGLVGRDTVKMFGRKPGGDRAFKGRNGGYVSATPSVHRGWKGDLAGRKIRSPKQGKTNEVAGQFFFKRVLSISAKSHRPGKYSPNGGGSVTGRRRDNRPLTTRAPGIGASGISKGLARTKGRKTEKGGGSISGGWNNKGQPINPRSPGEGSVRAGRFAGNIKGQRPEKGGGSVSGKLWNNKGQAINPREPGESSVKAGRFAGNIKGQRPEKGGGSVSGKLWNNKGKAINPREPGEGSLKAGRFAGNIKSKRPEKGGGSISGKLWNNKEKPIEVRTPTAEDAKAANYSGKMKLRRGYTQNDKAHDKSILKHRPNENTYMVNGLQVKVKRGKYEDKPKAAENAMPGIGPEQGTVRASKYGGNIKMARNYKHNPASHKDAMDGVPPTKSSVKASEYSQSLKMTWSYKHNPSSNDDALKVRGPKSEWTKATTFEGRMRLTKSYKHNPHSADEALKVLAPGKAYAKIGNYQGNIKMHKYNDKRLHPDAQFAHTHRDNVKGERTILMDVKLLWAKLFKKEETQPENLKDKGHRPRYDKGEKGLWADDPRYTKKQKAEQ